MSPWVNIALRRLYKERALKAEATLKRADQSIKALGALRLCSAAGSAATWLLFPPCQCHWKNWTGIDLEKSEREQQDRPYARLPPLFDFGQIPTLKNIGFFGFFSSSILMASFHETFLASRSSRCFFGGDPVELTTAIAQELREILPPLSPVT